MFTGHFVNFCEASFNFYYQLMRDKAKLSTEGVWLARLIGLLLAVIPHLHFFDSSVALEVGDYCQLMRDKNNFNCQNYEK
jgi:hypothetical protein